MTGRAAARLVPYGEAALLVEVEDLAAALRVHAAVPVVAQEVAGAGEALADAVVGARSVLLVGRDATAVPLLRLLASRAVDRGAPMGGGEPSAPAAEVVELPVTYDGDDLDEVARLTGLSTREVVRAHTGTPWLVGFAGFAPGFAYLVDGDPRLRVPRRATPRSRVPAGAVALADTFSGVYPRESPGGWQLIGRTDLRLWDLRREPPALLRPGQRVRFVDRDGTG